jgi:transcription elongation factor GreA
MSDTLLTADGMDSLMHELERLRARRAQIADELRGAYAAEGNLSENAEYHVALEDQALLERRIAILEQRCREAEIVQADPTDGEVGIGEAVRVRDLDSGDVLHYRIVGAGEADPANGHISYRSPVGAALLGRRANETIELDTPGGRLRLEVLRAT